MVTKSVRLKVIINRINTPNTLSILALGMGLRFCYASASRIHLDPQITPSTLSPRRKVKFYDGAGECGGTLGLHVLPALPPHSTYCHTPNLPFVYEKAACKRVRQDQYQGCTIQASSSLQPCLPGSSLWQKATISFMSGIPPSHHTSPGSQERGWVLSLLRHDIAGGRNLEIEDGCE